MSAPTEKPVDSPSNFLRTTLLGSVLVWLAFPPVGWSGLVWVAPVLWLRWITTHQLPGHRPYFVLWFAGTTFWLLTLHWIPLPHPLNYIAWLALASYLGVYLPVFMALSRVGVHCLRLPLWLVAPVVWTGLDWLRGHLFTGFLMGSLAHTQAGQIQVIQIANLLGEYGVTFLILLVAACLTQCLLSNPAKPARIQPKYLTPALFAVMATLIYATMQSVAPLADLKSNIDKPSPRIALIQGHTLADWKNDLDKQVSIMEEHLNLSFAAVKKSRERDHREVDLVIWPETAFRERYDTVDKHFRLPDDVPSSRLTAGKDYLQKFVRRLGCAVLVGIDHAHLSNTDDGEVEGDYYNAAVLVDRRGTVCGMYDKMHRVVLGEYVPFADWLPWLDGLSITGAVQRGEGPVAMQQGGVTYAVNICYETAVPHLIRRHVVQLSDQGQTPDVLVNLTNDAWFWGSSELDMHLACGVFRAVEMRTPLVIAANGGLSAHIDASGNILQRTSRQQTAMLLVDLHLPERSDIYPSVYAAHGDWFAILCVVCCTVFAIAGWRDKRRSKARFDRAVAE